MYKDFFGLREPPFNLTPDPRFLYLSQRHREALAALVYGIRERKGFIALTGEIGSGKTTLCRAFLKELNHDTTNVALVLNSFLTDLELLQTVNHEFGIDSSALSRRDLIDTLNRYLLEENARGKTSILIIDEAQNLAVGVLEQIRMLSNLETEENKLIQIVLIGQPELNGILALPELEQLNQRIMVRCHISPLARPEIHHYVRHRLHVAGAKINISLTPSALNRLHHYSGGIPRKINLLCDRALLAAFVAGRFQIDARMISVSQKELRNLGTLRGPRRWIPALGNPWIRSATALATLLAVLGTCFWFGMQMGTAPKRPAVAVATGPGLATSGTKPPLASAASPKSPAAPTDRRPTPSSPIAAPLPSPGPTTRTLAAAPAATLEALPVPTSDSLGSNWHWDANQIARVRDRELCRPAAMLTAARLWQYAFELKTFAALDPAVLRSLNLPRIFRMPQVGLASFETPSPLQSLLVLDLPLVLDIREPAGRLSPAVVLVRVRGKTAQLADPRLGLVELDLDLLAPRVRLATVVYHDPLNLESLAPGEESEAVAALRAFLSQEGVWEGPAGRTFDEDVVRAIQRFQEKAGLAGRGALDGPTAALICARREAVRPRLLSEQERK